MTRALGTGALSLACLMVADVSEAQTVTVHVEQRGDLVIVDVEAMVAAPSSVVFDVLTDYAHMARFLSSIKTSAVVGGQGDHVQVDQTGEARHGFLHFAFHTLRDVDVVPNKEIRSHLIQGDFKSYELTTRLTDQGSGTLITQHGEYIPNAWVPPGIGPSAIESETTKGYNELIAEILKRQHAATLPARPPASAPTAG